MSKKKVLIISPGLPYPPVDGHKLKLYNLALQLTEKVDLHLKQELHYQLYVA